jgi:hypothetical protein
MGDLEDLTLHLESHCLLTLCRKVAHEPSLQGLVFIEASAILWLSCPALYRQQIEEGLRKSLNRREGPQAHCVRATGIRDGNEGGIEKEQIDEKADARPTPQGAELEEKHAKFFSRHAAMTLMNILAPVADGRIDCSFQYELLRETLLKS